MDNDSSHSHQEAEGHHIAQASDGSIAIVGYENIAQIISGTAIGVTQVAGNYYAAPLTPIHSTAPAPPVYFTGRQAELDALAKALISGDTPQAIIALQGMGGIGKTVLAAQLAAQLSNAFPGGVFWADLPANRGEPLSVLAAWARMCGYDVGGMPDPHFRVQAVRGLLARRVKEQGRALVVLDDVRAGWLDGAEVLQSALPHNVPLLLTTRDEELALTMGATVCRLDILPLEQALELLAALTGPVIKREPDVARRLAEQVGCLPLALELAGKLAALRGRKPGFRLADLCAQVEVRATETLQLKGQRGLAACFSLSYETLDTGSQRLFRTLSIFAPVPFVAEHVASVLGWEEATAEAKLDELVALSLARWEEGGEGKVHYALHPLMYDYAAALLEEAGETLSTCVSHTIYYLAYAEMHNQPTATDYDALETEQPNILVAMDHAYQEGQWEQVCRFVRALTIDGARGFLFVRGYWDELGARLEQAIRAAETEGNERDIATFTHSLAILAQSTGEYTKARRLYRQSLDINKELENYASIASTLCQLGLLAQSTGEYAEARRSYQQSLDISEDIGNQIGIAGSLHLLGELAYLTGTYVEARHLCQQSLIIFEQLGDRVSSAKSMHDLGIIALSTKEYAEARHLFQQSLEVFEELGDLQAVAATLSNLGAIAQTVGEYVDARRLYQQSFDISEKLGNRPVVALTLINLGVIAQTTGEYAEARRLLQQGLTINEELGNRAAIATALINLGAIAQIRGEYAEARRLYRQSLGINKELGNRASITRSKRALRMTYVRQIYLTVASGILGFLIGILLGAPTALLVGIVIAIIGLISYKSVLADILAWALSGAFIGLILGREIVYSMTGFILGVAVSRRLSAWLPCLGIRMRATYIRYRVLLTQRLRKK